MGVAESARAAHLPKEGLDQVGRPLHVDGDRTVRLVRNGPDQPKAFGGIHDPSAVPYSLHPAVRNALPSNQLGHGPLDRPRRKELSARDPRGAGG